MFLKIIKASLTQARIFYTPCYQKYIEIIFIFPKPVDAERIHMKVGKNSSSVLMKALTVI